MDATCCLSSSLHDLEAGFSRYFCCANTTSKGLYGALMASLSFPVRSPKKAPIFFYEDDDDECLDDKTRCHSLGPCALCKDPLGLGGRDTFMYKGNIPFCSEECRQERMEADEAVEERKKKVSSSYFWDEETLALFVVAIAFCGGVTEDVHCFCVKRS